MIKVYQIHLSDAEYDAAEMDGVITDKVKAYYDRMFDWTFKPHQRKFYTHVANVHTDNTARRPVTVVMDEAFQLMNLWEDDEKVEKLDRCCSMSVGDILEVDGKFYRCAAFGFELIEE
jgi:hypothetical protein